MKFKEFLEKANELATNYPQSLDMDIIYSIDDEGNAYHKVHSEPSLVQVEDPSEYYLDIVGFYKEGQNDIALEDCNVVIIN